jgi:four helix bundle protein
MGVGVMNDPEVTMLEAPSNQLVALTTALEAAGEALAIARRVPAPLRSLADQVVRSAASVAANLSEGHGRSGRDRLHHWHIAYASAKEVDTHLRLLAGAGAIDVGRARAALDLFDQVRAMTWRLLHPRG